MALIFVNRAIHSQVGRICELSPALDFYNYDRNRAFCRHRGILGNGEILCRFQKIKDCAAL